MAGPSSVVSSPVARQAFPVAIDFDGCLARTQDLVAALVNFRHGTEYTARDVINWGWWEQVGLGDDMWEAFDLMTLAGLRRSLRPYDEHVGPVLHRITRDPRFRAAVVSANPPDAQPDIAAWVNALVPTSIPVRCIGRTGVNKLDLPFQVYLDDKNQMARDIERYPGKFLLLANARWNGDIPDGPQVRRFRSWAEVPSLLSHIYNFGVLP